MRLEFSLLDLRAALPGCTHPGQLRDWACGRLTPLRDMPLPPSRHIPRLLARRLDAGCRLAVELALELWLDHPQLQAAVFCSRHGELRRNHSILQALAAGTEVSPTDFTMSVHNAAAAGFTIASGLALPVTALSAGADTFCQSFLEVRAMLARQLQPVLLVCHDTCLPEDYLPVLPEECREAAWAHAVALVLSAGRGCSLEFGSSSAQEPDMPPDGGGALPQELAFLRGCLLGAARVALPAAGRPRTAILPRDAAARL